LIAVRGRRGTNWEDAGIKTTGRPMYESQEEKGYLVEGRQNGLGCI